MSKDRYLDCFLFCSMLEDEEPSIEKERAYRKYLGEAFNDTNLVLQVTSSYTLQEEWFSLTLKAILSNYSESIYSSFFNSNRQLFLDSLFGEFPDLQVETYQPNQQEKNLIQKMFSGSLHAFSWPRNTGRYNQHKDVKHHQNLLFNLFYLSPKFMQQTIEESQFTEDQRQQIIYSVLFKDNFSFDEKQRHSYYYEDCIFPAQFVHDLISFNSSSNKSSFLSYKNSFPGKDDETILKWAEDVSYVLNNESFQNLVFSTLSSLAVNISEYSLLKSIGFRRLSSLLKNEKYTSEVYDNISNSLEKILFSNYHTPIGANHSLIEIAFKNRRERFDEMINLALIKRGYDNPVRAMLYTFCIHNNLFTTALAKALTRETSSSVVEKVYDDLFFKNKNADGIKKVQKNSSEVEFEQILSHLSETKHSTALRIFAKGAPLKYLTRIIGQDKYADETISQRFEAGK